jgi:phosphatidylglycerol:prolipoprotein diacylglycerol transferase
VSAPQYFIDDFSPFVFEFREGVGVRWYGVGYVLAFVLGGWLYKWLARRGYTDLPEAKVSDFITWAAVFAVMVGGRLGWLLFYGLWQNHAGDPWWWPFAVWQGGMSSHGGFVGMILFTLWWSWKYKVSWTSLGDGIVIVAPIGMFLVRMANFINGELWGRVAGEPGGKATVPWAVLFPGERADLGYSLEQIQHSELVRQHLREILPPRHPSQIYEALLEGVLLFAVFFLLRTRWRVPRGVLTGLFFICYAVVRIIGEFFRQPDAAWSIGWISAGQFLSLFMLVIGAAFATWGWRHPVYERAWLSK